MGLAAYGAASVSTDSAGLGIQGFSVQEAIRTRQFWVICVMFLCAIFCSQTVMVHIVPHVTDIGIPAAVAATILSVVGILSIGSKIGMGGIVDRIGNKRVMIVVLILMLASFLWVLLANQLWMLYLFAIAFGIVYGGLSVVQSPIVAEYFGLRAHGAIYGLVMFAAQVGGAIGSLVAGSVFDASGSYFWAFILCLILCGASLALSTLLGARISAGSPGTANSLN